MNMCRKGMPCEFATINGFCQLTYCVKHDVPLPPINWKKYYEMLDNYYPLSQHSVEYYRYQNTLIKANGKKKKRKKK